MVGEVWAREKLYILGDEYFNDLEAAIKNAQRTIEVEMYIFANDTIGRRFHSLLSDAARRGIVVRLLLDAVGSSGWESTFAKSFVEAGGSYRIYNPLRYWHIRLFNKRTHRKLILIDKKTAFVGSRNFTDAHSESLYQDKVWFDLTIAVEGSAFSDLERSFDALWKRAAEKMLAKLRPLKLITEFPQLVRMNLKWKQRRANYVELKTLLRSASHRILIMTGYFVPTRGLLVLLCRAAQRGVKVEIILPRKSDVFFMEWISTVYFSPLIRSGVLVYTYTPSMIHAKSITIDDWMTVGSSNFNHRSILHDKETDIVLCDPAIKTELQNAFETTKGRSKVVREQTISVVARCLGNILLYFRSYL